MRININDFYIARLEQIEEDLKKQYYKGKRKDKAKIAKLLEEKTRIKNLIKD